MCRHNINMCLYFSGHAKLMECMFSFTLYIKMYLLVLNFICLINIVGNESELDFEHLAAFYL